LTLLGYMNTNHVTGAVVVAVVPSCTYFDGTYPESPGVRVTGDFPAPSRVIEPSTMAKASPR